MNDVRAASAATGQPGLVCAVDLYYGGPIKNERGLRTCHIEQPAETTDANTVENGGTTGAGLYSREMNSSESRPTSVFLTAEWRDLVMLNYVVDPASIAKFVPRGTELDSWNGKAFLSLVGFRFLKTRALGVSLPFHRNFDEVNLRFYVRREDASGVKRGVVFIREIVPRWFIAAVARVVYNENYVALPMRHSIEQAGKRISVGYAWRIKGSWNKISLEATGKGREPERNSQEEFITEHYWGYAAQRDGGCVEYEVEHPRWKIWSATKARFEGDGEDLYGHEIGAVLRNAPASAFLAEGSEVAVYRGKRI
jgi:uncharacterized protein YqjF (DUF2071 family)